MRHRHIALTAAALVLLASGCSRSAPPAPPVTAPAPAPAVAEQAPAPAPALAPAASAPAPVTPKIATQKISDKYGNEISITLASGKVKVEGPAGRKLELATDLPSIINVSPLKTYEAGPDGTDNLLVVVSDGHTCHAWVLRPTESGYAVIYQAETDSDIRHDGNLLRLVNRRYKSAGGYDLVAQQYAYVGGAAGYAPITTPAALDALRVQVLGTAPWPAGGTAWVVADPESHLQGVYVERQGKLTVLRPPTPEAGELVGPDTLTGLLTADLDADGTPEYLLQGLAGAHTTGLWVYQDEKASGGFRLLASLAGDNGASFTKGADGKYTFQTTWRNLTAGNGAVITRHYVWSKDHFVETP